MNDDELLLRQVSPSFVQQGRVTSQLFRPTPKDDLKLSVYHGGMIEAGNAWQHYTNELGLNSLGVMAVTVVECRAEQLEAIHDGRPFDCHAHIAYQDWSRSAIESKSKRLTRVAVERDWLYQTQ